MVLFTANIAPQAGDALLIIDVQNDSLTGNSLAPPAAEPVIAALNACIAQFVAAHLPVFASRNGNPADHRSFRNQDGTCPAHGVAGTEGAQFPAALDLPADTRVIAKSAQRDANAHSSFANTDLHEQLQRNAVRRLWVGGLATDYGVRHTVHDALRLGYGVLLLLDCISPVDARHGDGERAIAAMLAAGAVAATATRR